jgi:DNA-binding IclR family transcriptional regulator
MSANEPYPGTQAVLRAIALLKSFTDRQPQLSLVELARQVGLNKTTAYRLLSALEREGMITRSSETDAYRLGPEAIVIGGRALRANELRAVSRVEIEGLARQLGEAVSLEVLDGGEVLILDEVAGGYLVSPNQSIGTRWPAHATSTGKVLLSDLPLSERNAVLRPPLAQLTHKTMTAPEMLRRELDRSREQGFAVADEELEVGFMAIGAPVHDHNNRVIAAISINAPTARLTPDRIPEIAVLVMAAAGRISAQLGYRPNEAGPDEAAQ